MTIFPGLLRRSSKSQEISLGNINIASPCPAEWSKMIGDERMRHCSECNLNVYNLSAMTEREVERLLAASNGQRLCTRFYRRADGTVLTQDCPWSFRVMARRVSRLATAVLTAVLSINFASARNHPKSASCDCQETQQRDPGLKLTVMDQHGAVIPNAKITLKQKSGTEQLSGSTGATGEWSTAKVASGEYAITVQSQGFRTFTSAVNIRDGMLLGLKLKLPIAEVNTTVTVEATQAGVMGGISTFVKNSDTVPSVSSGGRHFPIRP
jgi:hypothetical protein